MSTATNSGGYSGIKTVIFTIGIAFLILASLYVARCCNNCITIQETFRSRFRGHPDRDPPEFTPGTGRNGQSAGDEPRISDVWIASWYPLSSQPKPRLENQGPTQDQEDGQKLDPPDSTIDRQGRRSLWAGILPLSAEKVSSADTTTPSELEVDDSSNPTSSTQIQISTIILMPSRPPTSLPSTSSPNGIYDLSREYALGTFSVPYTHGD